MNANNLLLILGGGYKTFRAVSGVAPSTTDVTSRRIIINVGPTPVDVSVTGVNGEYRVDDGAWLVDTTSVTGICKFTVRIDASSLGEDTITCTLIINGIEYPFRVTTSVAEEDPLDFDVLVDENDNFIVDENDNYIEVPNV